MIKVRNNVFETNSSSSHSLVVTTNRHTHYTHDEIKQELWLDEHSNKFQLYSDEGYFGRSPFQVLYTFRDKLLYAYANAPIRKGTKDGKTYYWSEYYRVTNVVKQIIPEFEGLEILGDTHISCDTHYLRGWLKKLNCSLKEFLLNKSIIVIVDGDEYHIWRDMKQLGLVDRQNIEQEL